MDSMCHELSKYVWLCGSVKHTESCTVQLMQIFDAGGRANNGVPRVLADLKKFFGTP